MEILKIIFLLFVTCNVAHAKVDIVLDKSSPEQFSYVEAEQGLQIHFTNLSTKQLHKLSLPFTLSDLQKVTLVPSKEDKSLPKPVEMLLTVLSKGNALQLVQVYVPTNPNFIIKKNNMPACELSNDGDFSWNSPEELKKKLRLFKDGNKTLFQIEVSKMKKTDQRPSDAKAHWVTCFGF